MGIFDKIFNRKEEIEQQPVETPLEIQTTINSIIIILENLSLLNKEEIRQRVIEKDKFDESILDKLTITPPENIEYLEKYYGKARFGYGSTKARQIKEKLKAIATEKTISNVPTQTIIDGLLTLTEVEITAYQGILKRFNESLKEVEENSKDYLEMNKMIEYWKNYYKEQELGYPIPLDKKITEMAEELRNLPYGGYGEEEIEKFVSAATKIVEEAKLNHEDSSHTLSRINSDLFTSLKNRYLADVENLKRKMQMIDESPYISDFEKEQNKQKVINEFNVMNGHKQDIDGNLEQLKKNLSLLEYGGYGEEVINQFTKRAETMMSDGKRIMKPELEVQKEIHADYQRLVDAYQKRLAEMKEQINVVDQSTSLTLQEKDQKKALILEEFHDEMGLPIDYQERINAMILELKGLDRGGYGELKIEEFKTKSLERLASTTSRIEIRDALKEIRELQDRLIKEYKEELRKLYDASERVSHDRHLTQIEKERAIEEFDREFKFKMGYRMNFDKYIDNRCEELSTLPGGGYGKEAVDEFRTSAKTIASSVEDEKTKYDHIRLKFNALKKQYNTNIKVFKEWKRIQLQNAKEAEKDMLEKDLNVKIAYMLSLSPEALQDYYMEDDRKKREQADQHNYVAAFKFLARQEAKHGKDETIYDKRIQDLEEGREPYTKEEIEDATRELEILSLSNEELQDDERVISLVEYIDSTILRQIMYVEAGFIKSEPIH